MSATAIDPTTVAETNVIVLSYAGKPIFWRFGDDKEIIRLCGLIQALKASQSQLGHMRSIRTRCLTVVFMTAGAITLIAVSKRDANGETELLLKLKLEYVYSHILFTLTNQVQKVFEQYPNYDLSVALGASETEIRKTLDQFDVQGRPWPFLVGAIEPLQPIEPSVRDYMSKVLLEICGKTPNTVFAILLAGEKLLCLIQPSYLPHQLLASDLRLLVNFVSGQAGLLSSELWFPVCLPRFNPTGFLHTYTACFNESSKLALVLVSQMNSTQQFQLFQRAAKEVRRDLGLPDAVESIIQIMEKRSSTNTGSSDDVEWKRLDDVSERSSKSVADRGSSRGDAALALEEEALWDCPLLMVVKAATAANLRPLVIDEYADKAEEKPKHFLLRRNVVVKGPKIQECGYLPQCISCDADHTFQDTATRQRVWRNYQKLSLKVRIGSSTAEAFWDGFDGVAERQLDGGNEEIPCQTSSVAMAMAESIPDLNSISYIIEGQELFLAMSGPGFELYTVYSGSVTIKKATASCAKLVAALLADESKLFLMSPLTWKD